MIYLILASLSVLLLLLKQTMHKGDEKLGLHSLTGAELIRVLNKHKKHCHYLDTWSRGYNTFFKLSSAEHEISTAHEC